ncbi:DUF4224 domain-containing protein [Methyloversatilis sp. NSM2]|uniref:DUF4224 domain-containing protein n=1 Tax=Methyloversatilis sp. NSM2 TaxID=3134135 RepID=UPI00310D0B6B
MNDGLFLTDAEIARICEPLVQPAAQVRFLRELGLTVATKPNGRALVVRSHAEAVLSGRKHAEPQQGTTAPAAAPNRSGLIEFINRRRAA